jgi:hypothetical protein
MVVKVFLTYEINDKQWEEIRDGFNKSFKRTSTIDDLKKYYTSTVKGYSYHALAFNDLGQVIGSNVVTPMPYINNLILGYSGGTYLLESYRNDISLLRRMLNALEQQCNNDGIKAILAVPNKNSLIYFKRVAKYSQIDTLHYLVLPVKIAPILKLKSLFFLDLFSIAFSWLIVLINYILSLFYNPVSQKVKYELSTEKDFFDKRFSSKHYKHIEKKDFECYYRVFNEGNIKTAYIMEYRYKGQRNLRALVLTCLTILKDTNCDIVMFIGHLRLKQLMLFKLPKKFEPQPLPLVYKILDASDKDNLQSMSQAINWKFSLVNFDAR